MEFCVKRAFQNVQKDGRRIIYDRDNKPDEKNVLGYVYEREWSAAKQNQPVTLYDPRNSKVVGQVPRTSSESNIRYHLDRMERDSREYNKTVKLLNLTSRNQNKKRSLVS